VLVHSPSVGPATWAPVAQELARRGYDAVVPSLLDVADGEPPVWPRVAAAVADAVAGVPADRPVVLAAHSNAGLFVPVIRTALRQSVMASVFVDASLPAREGATPVAEAEFLDFLRGLAGPDGWADHPCVYVMFGLAYEAAAQAAARGWPVWHLPGEHLHQLVDPAAVTDVLVSECVA